MRAKMIFLLYDSRSGSTYLSALLNRYQGVSVSLESAFTSHIIEYPGEISRQKLDSIIAYLQKEVQFRELGVNVNQLKQSLQTSGKELTKKRLIQAIVSQYFAERDSEAEYLVIKHPPYAYLAAVTGMFPEVQFIQIIRDGRAVFNSKKKTRSLSGGQMATNPLKAAWRWRLKLQRAEKYEQRTITVFYEDLVQKQEQTLGYILDELNVSEKGRTITKKQSDYFRSIGKAQKGLHENVAQSPRTDAIDKWKRELSSAEINVYNFVNQSYLRKYHYEVDEPPAIPTFIMYAIYWLKFCLTKMKNLLWLLKNPSLLRLKCYRNFFLIKDK